jgi:hypothetical protein
MWGLLPTETAQPEVKKTSQNIDLDVFWPTSHGREVSTVYSTVEGIGRNIQHSFLICFVCTYERPNSLLARSSGCGGGLLPETGILKELLRNKLRFTWGWAVILSMAHILWFKYWTGWPDLSFLSVPIMCMHRGARPKVSLRWRDLRINTPTQNDDKFRLKKELLRSREYQREVSVFREWQVFL